MKTFQEYLEENNKEDITKLLKDFKPDIKGKTAIDYKITYDKPSDVPNDFDKLKKLLDKHGIGYAMNTSKSSKGTIQIEGDDGNKHRIFFKPSQNATKGPSGAEWESVIAVGVNKLKGKNWDVGPEWDVASKFWEDYGGIGEAIAKDFISKLGVDKLQGTGQSSASLNPKWKGTNTTPKTDIKSSKYNISLKKAGGSQLMSAKKDELISTVEAAQETFGKANKKEVENLVNIMEKKMVTLTEKDSVSSVDKLREKEKLTPKEAEQIAELDAARIGGKEVENEFNNVFSSEKFMGHFCFEAATGNVKFKDSWPSANVVCTFNPDQAKLENVLVLDSPEGAGVKLARGNSFYVAFKSTAGSKPYLSFRSKAKSKKAMKSVVNETAMTFSPLAEDLFKTDYPDTLPSLRTIMIEELSKGGLLTEEMQQLDEFAMLNNLKQQVSDFTNKAKGVIMKVWKSIIERIKKAFAIIKKLGGKALRALARFFGFEIGNVRLTKTGGMYPVDTLIFNK